MGKGICADSYVGDRQAQERFRDFFGGSSELPIDIRRRLDRQKLRKKNIARNRRGQKGNNSYE
ncbi:MAG: hypothetical protein IJP68_00040 [Selenomonadaceae bacterium]|nr:hypothetical protein [Selenomonadaceae bacterium]